MTSDELIQHWRDLLTVPQDDDPVTYRFGAIVAALLFESVSQMADLLGTPQLTPRERQEMADIEKRLAEAQRVLSEAEAGGIEIPQLPDDDPAVQKLREAEARRDALEAGVRSGKFVEKATVIAAVDRALLAALHLVRSEVRKVRGHLNGDWSAEEIEEWWIPIAERAIQPLETVFRR